MMREHPLNDRVTVECDASFKENVAGLAAIVRAPNGQRIAERALVATAETSDEAERLAALVALELAASVGARRVMLHTDNDNLARGLDQALAGSKTNVPEWTQEFATVVEAFEDIKCRWKPRDELCAVDYLSRVHTCEDPRRTRARTRVRVRREVRQLVEETRNVVKRLRKLSAAPLDELQRAVSDCDGAVRDLLRDVMELGAGLDSAMDVAAGSCGHRGQEWPRGDVLDGCAAA